MMRNERCARILWDFYDSSLNYPIDERQPPKYLPEEEEEEEDNDLGHS